MQKQEKFIKKPKGIYSKTVDNRKKGLTSNINSHDYFTKLTQHTTI